MPPESLLVQVGRASLARGLPQLPAEDLGHVLSAGAVAVVVHWQASGCRSVWYRPPHEPGQ